MREGATGGSITTAGLYTAPNNPETYHIVATSQADNTKSATAKVIVPSFSITITPAAVSLRPGATQTLSASVTRSSNKAVMWSVQEGSVGGMITDTVVYTAPTTLGTYHVIATSVADFAKTATETVFVVEAGSFRPTGRLSTRRDYHTATLLSDGNALVAGGDRVSLDRGRAPAAAVKAISQSTGADGTTNVRTLSGYPGSFGQRLDSREIAVS